MVSVMDSRAFSLLQADTGEDMEEEASSLLGDLPVDFVALILCRMPPRDVARAACVCRSFRAAAAFESVWAHAAVSHLPAKYSELVALEQFASERDLFDHLCTNLILFADNTQGFRMERATGGLCVAMAARGMYIEHVDAPQYWQWVPNFHHALFPEVAQLMTVCWLEAIGEMECSLPAGTYTACWRIMLSRLQNFGEKPVTFRLSKNDEQVVERQCFIDPRPPRYRRRSDGELRLPMPTVRVVDGGWREYDAGEFTVNEHDVQPCVLKFSMTAIEEGQDWKSGISLDGVVVRPSNTITHIQPESRDSLIRFLETKDREPVYNHRFRR